jgi:hypothetical protein
MSTMKDLRPITWWIFWRYILIGGIVGVLTGGIVGAMFGFTVAIFGGSIETIQKISPFLGAFAGLFVAFYTLNFLLAKLIGKTIRGKRLMLVDAE